MPAISATVSLSAAAVASVRTPAEATNGPATVRSSKLARAPYV